MSKMAALGQSIGGMFPSDEIVKGSISGYVFEQFEIACYTSLLAAAKQAGDTASIPALESILEEERQMADWLLQHIPQTTEQFLLRSDADGVEAKNNEIGRMYVSTRKTAAIHGTRSRTESAWPIFCLSSLAGHRANLPRHVVTLRKD